MKNLIGIEFGEGTVCIYQKKKDGAVMCFKDVLINADYDLQYTERDMQVAVLKELVDSAELDGKDCAVVLPDRNSFFRTLYLSPMTEEELMLNLPYEFKDYVGDKSSDYTYDYAINNIIYDENDQATEMELFAAAGSTSVIDNIESVIEEAGLRLSVVLPREMTMINLFRNAEDEGVALDKEYCLVNIGYSSSRVDIFKNGILKGSKVIDFGINVVDQAIAMKYSVDLKDAEEYRKANTAGVLSSEECVKEYDALMLEIMKAINFYRYEHQDSEINEVHFVGMNSNCAPMRQRITAGLEMKEKNVHDILPLECEALSDAYRGIGAIGVTL